MDTKFKTINFFISQLKKNYKKSLIVIAIFGISFSLLSGFTYGADTLEQSLTENLQDNGIPQISDLSFVFYDERLIVGGYSESLENEIYDRVTPIKNSFKYSTQWGQNVQFTKANVSFHEYGVKNIVQNYLNSFTTVMGDNSFYNSSRFPEMITLLEGDYPQAETEILIDISYAQAFDYSVGQLVTLDYELLNPYLGFVNKTSQRDYEITGIYAPISQDIQLGFSLYNFDYIYDFENNTISLLNRQPQFFGSGSIVQNAPIFGFIDFANILFNPLYLEIERSVLAYEILNWFSTGIAVNLDFEIIEFDQLEVYLSDLNSSLRIIMESRENRVAFNSYFLANLESLQTTFQRARILIPLLNLPLLFFAIIMGSMAIKNDLYNRMEEFLLLRSKGTSIKLIRNEMLFEAILQGVFSSTIGALLGIPIFYSIRNLMNNIFLGMDLVTLTYILNWESILLMFGIGLIAAIGASIASIVYISRIPISVIINKLKQNSVDGITELMDIYKEEKKSTLELYDDKVQNSNNKDKNQNLSIKDIRALKRDKQRKDRRLQKIYKISNRNFNFEKNILSLIYLAVAILPIIIIAIGSWGQSPTSPDIIFNFYENNKNFFSLGTMFVLLTPFFLTLSVIRFISVEKNSILARISRRFSQPFIGNLSKLLGIEHIRRRQYVTLTSVIGVFISLIVFINIFLTSNLNIPYVEDNLKSGADVNIQYSTSLLGTDPYLNDGNVSILEDQLLNIYDNQNRKVVDDVITLYMGVPIAEMLPGYVNPITGQQSAASTSRFTHFMIYTDLTKLSQFLYDDGKYDYTESQQLIESIASNKSDSNIPNCIVSERYLYSTGTSAGQLIQIPHGYQNETLDVIQSPFDARILGSSDDIPGLWLKSVGTSLEEHYEVIPFSYVTTLTTFILMDISVLNSLQYNLNNFTIATMVDLNNEIPLNLDLKNEIISSVQNISLNFNWVSSMNFYIDSYQEYLATTYDQTEIFLVNYGFLIEFSGIGLIIALSISVLSVSLFNNNIFFNQLLLSKGIGRNGLFKFYLNLLLNIFLVGLIVGGIIGWISGVLLFKSNFFVRTFVPFQSSIPLSIDFLSMLIIITIIPVSFITINFLNYKFGKKDLGRAYQRDF